MPEKPNPEAISDLCHDTATALSKLGPTIPPPVGPIISAAGAITEVACDIYDMTNGIEPKTALEGV